MSLRVVFMGTPDFAAAVLRRLVEDRWAIAAVFTSPDKPKNRGMKMLPTPVKEYALTQEILVFQPVSCRDGAVLEQLRSLEPDVVVVAAYGKLLPQELLDIPKKAIINVHSSILPQYRGAAPINWAILNGDQETGVTIQYMAAELDAGDILLVKRTPIGPDEDAGQLYSRLAELGGEAASEALRLLEEGGAPRTPQVYGPQYQYASMLSREMSPMDWGRPARELVNQVRDLMAEAAGRQVLPFRLKPVAKPVLRPNPDTAGAGHHPPLAGDAETSLRPGLFAGLGENLRVHQLQHLVRVIHHDHCPTENADLRGCQPSPLGLCQGVLHIVQELVEPVVEIRHLTALLSQHRVSLGYDFSNRHGYFVLLRAGINFFFQSSALQSTNRFIPLFSFL